MVRVRSLVHMDMRPASPGIFLPGAVCTTYVAEQAVQWYYPSRLPAASVKPAIACSLSAWLTIIVAQNLGL